MRRSGLLFLIWLCLAVACNLAEEISDRRDKNDADALPDEGEGLRLSSPVLKITLQQDSNILEWDEVEGAIRYDLYVSLVDDVSMENAEVFTAVVSPYLHLKDPANYYNYSLIAIAEVPSANSLPANLVNDIPTGLTASCLNLEGEDRRTMDAILEATALKDCYRLADGIDDVTELDLSGNELVSLEALKFFSKLEVLDLSDNLIVDLKVLQELVQLKRLNLNSNGELADISPLASLQELESLRLSFNAITDLSAIKDLVELRAFEAAGNQLQDVSVVAGFTKLESLSLANNPVVRTENTCPVVSVIPLLAQFCYNGVTITYAAHIQKLMNLHCVTCHANLGAEAGVIAQADLANSHIQAGTMPQGADPLSAIDKMIFAQWFANLPQPVE